MSFDSFLLALLWEVHPRSLNLPAECQQELAKTPSGRQILANRLWLAGRGLLFAMHGNLLMPPLLIIGSTHAYAPHISPRDELGILSPAQAGSKTG